jgi:hypothetical protein
MGGLIWLRDVPLFSLLLMAGSLVWAVYGCTAPYRRGEKANNLEGIAEAVDGFRHVYRTRDERVLELVQALHRGATMYGFIAGVLFGIGLCGLRLG